jgi:hypothetical protein
MEGWREREGIGRRDFEWENDNDYDRDNDNDRDYDYDYDRDYVDEGGGGVGKKRFGPAVRGSRDGERVECDERSRPAKAIGKRPGIRVIERHRLAPRPPKTPKLRLDKRDDRQIRHRRIQPQV